LQPVEEKRNRLTDEYVDFTVCVEPRTSALDMRLPAAAAWARAANIERYLSNAIFIQYYGDLNSDA